MAFPPNPSPGDTHVENNTTYTYNGPINGWTRSTVGPANDSFYPPGSAAQYLSSITETIYTVVDGASVDLSPANGPTQLWTLGDNRTPTAANFADGQVMTLLVDDGTDYAITWTTMAVTWLGGSAPTLETAGYTAILLFKIGGTIYGKA